MEHQCKQCGNRDGTDISPAPDDCTACGWPRRWIHRRDGRNLLTRFHQWKRDQLKYPPPPEDDA